MKHKKNILLGACLLLALSCSDTDVSPPSSTSDDDQFEQYRQEGMSAGLPWGQRSGNKAGAAIPLNTISHSTLQSALNTNLLGIKNYLNAPNTYIRYHSGLPYVNLGHVIGNSPFGYPAEWNFRLNAVPPSVFPTAAVRADVSNKLNQMSVTAQFRSRVLTLFDIAMNMDSYDYSSFAGRINGQLFAIANQQRGQAGGILSPLEQFALSQVFFHVKYTAESAKNNYNTICNLTREEWKGIVENTIAAGVVGGLGLAGVWGLAGAAAVPINPILGAIVGAYYGFITGFVSGSLTGGAAQIIAKCITNKLFNPLQVYHCGTDKWGNVGITMSTPEGCINGYDAVLNPYSIQQLPMVPNDGATALNPGVVNDLNWFRSYLGN